MFSNISKTEIIKFTTQTLSSANALNLDKAKILSLQVKLTLYLTMPFLGSSNSAANIDMMSKILTNGDTILWLSRKHCGKRRNCSLWAISPFPTMFSKAVCCWCFKMSMIMEKKGLRLINLCKGIHIAVSCLWTINKSFIDFFSNSLTGLICNCTKSLLSRNSTVNHPWSIN